VHWCIFGSVYMSYRYQHLQKWRSYFGWWIYL